MSVLVCGVISGLYAYQQQALQRSEAALDNIRRARIDLTEGFLHLALGDDGTAPFARDQGLALLRQALAALEAAASGRDERERAADALGPAVGDFRARLQEWRGDALGDPAAAVQLRIALHRLIAEADRADELVLSDLQALSRRLGSIFLGVIAGAALLLAAICGAIFYAGRAKDASEAERSRTEEALRETAQTLGAIMSSSPLAIVAVSIKGEVLVWSREAERLFGLTVEELDKDLFSVLPPAAGEAGTDLPGRAQSGQVLRNVEIRRQRKDGSQVDIRYSCAPLRDRQGRLSGMLYVADDVTERKAIEVQLAQSQKMEAIGNLAGGIAHDFNNTLGVIIGNIELLLGFLPKGSEQAAMAETALQAVQRGADLTAALLAFARRQPLSARVTDVNALIRGMSPMLQRSLGEEISIHIATAEDLWKVQVDPGQLQAALLNLAANARDAMPEGGSLTIEIANTTIEEGPVAAALEVQAGDYLRVTVADTGVGMAPEVLGRIFEPFFTTKDSTRGTGLGLSMVFGFVKQSGGHIKAYSEPGYGTTMKLYLPRATMAEDDGESADRGEALPVGGGEVILAVEDNPDMRRTVVGQIRSLGYSAIEAESPAAALDLLGSGMPIDLLFTDIIMPGGMSGIELARTARVRRPELKIVATSGFHQDALQNGSRLPAGVPLLTKPYRLADLARKLRDALDSSPPPALP